LRALPALLQIRELTCNNIPWLIGVGLFPGFLAILFVIISLSRLPAAMFSTIAYSEPVAVVIFGWTLFNESLSLTQICGCFIIIFSGIIKTFNKGLSNK
jgi:drug/metabolite transporter (DMT)-like permease